MKETLETIGYKKGVPFLLGPYRAAPLPVLLEEAVKEPEIEFRNAVTCLTFTFEFTLSLKI